MGPSAGFDIRLGVKDAAAVRRAFEGMGKDGQRALKKLDKASRDAAKGGSRSKRSFDSLSASARVLEGPLGGVAGRMTAIGAAARLTNPLLLAAGVAFAGGLLVLKKTITAYEEFERRQLRTNALLQVTRQSSGQTAESLEALAQSIGRGTLASASGVRDASAALLTFKAVSGDAFGRTLRLAQDLSAVLGQDLKAATLQLGKALEDPERNLSQLNRSGISFTQTTIDLVKNLKATGDEAGALDVILSNIEAQVGGAGAAEGGGVAGAWDNFTEALNGFLERAGEFTRAGPAFAFALDNFYTPILDSTKEAPLDARLRATRARIVDIRKEIEADSKLTPIALALGFSAEEDPKQKRRLAGELARFDTQQGAQGARARAREGAARAADLAAKQRADEAQAARDRKQDAKDEAVLFKARVAAEKELGGLNKKSAEAFEQREKALREILDSAEREVELSRLSSAEKEIQVALDNARKAAGGELSKQEEDRLVIAKRQTAQIEAARQAQSDAIATNKREAERATGEIVDIGRDAIDSILDSGKASDFFDSLVTFARRSFAQIASEALIRPIVQPLVFAATGAGAIPGANAATPGGGGFGLPSLSNLGSGVSNFLNTPVFGAGGFFGGGAPAASTGATFFGEGGAVAAGTTAGGATLGATLGAAGIGFLGGQLLAEPLGLNPTTASLGAGAGAGIGFLAGGPVGAAIGGGIGLLAGFIGGNKKPSNFGQSVRFDLRDGISSQVLNNPRETNAEVEGLAQAIVKGAGDAIAQILAATGGSLNTQSFIAEIGRRDPTLVRVGGQVFRGPVGDSDFAIEAALKGLLAGGISGAGPLVDKAARATGGLRNGTGEILADLALAQAIQELRDGTTDLERGIRGLSNEFKDAALRARELGLPVAELTTRLRAQSADLVDSFFGPLLDPLRAVRGGLTAASQSPGDRFAAAEAEARRLLTAGQGGDIAAIRAAPGAVALADQLGGQVFSAASPQLASLRGDLGAGLDSIIGNLEGERDALARDFSLSFAGSIDRQTRSLVEEFQALREVLGRQLEIVAESQKALAPAIKKVEKAVRDAPSTRGAADGPGGR